MWYGTGISDEPLLGAAMYSYLTKLAESGSQGPVEEDPLDQLRRHLPRMLFSGGVGGGLAGGGA